MKALPLILLGLPMIYVVIGWLFGLTSVRRFIFLLLGWIIACEIAAVYALITTVDKMGFPDPKGFAIALLFGFAAWFGPVLAAFASTRVHPVAHPPVAVAADAYASLTPDQKDKVHTFARFALKVGARYASDHLHSRGYTRSADTLNRGSRLI